MSIRQPQHPSTAAIRAMQQQQQGKGPSSSPMHNTNNSTTATQQRAVSEQIMEFLLTELSLYAAKSSSTVEQQDEEGMTVAAEMAAAKLERMGAAVGYRITERLAETKTWSAAPNISNQDTAAIVAAQQLEAVKFLCKDVWIEIFNKQIDKLQTNHRGVFVLKDLELKWLTRFPVGSESSRVAAIRLLAFPCGVVRGALANLGVPAVVSCDFLADGQNMAACSFNIKVK